MKRILIFSLISLIVLGIVACEAVDTPSNEGITQEEGDVHKSSSSDEAKLEGDNDDNLKTEDDNADNHESTDDEADDSSKEQSKTKLVTVYFSDSDGLRLVGEERTVDNITPEALIGELIKGPQNADNNKTIPDGTKLLGVEVKGKTAYVDFSKELKDNHWGGSTGELFTIYSIVNTLVLQPDLDIERVQFLIEGQTVETLAGHADISIPLEADLPMVDMK